MFAKGFNQKQFCCQQHIATDASVHPSASKADKSFLGKKFFILSKRMKAQKALIAITRKILVIIYNVLKTQQPFDHYRNIQATVA
jgi:hypothetical protein